VIKKIYTLSLIFCICFLTGFSIESSKGRWEKFTFKDNFLVSNQFKSIFEDSKGNIWCISWGRGVSKFDGATWRNFKTGNGLISNTIETYMLDSQGNVWFFGPKLRFSTYNGKRMIKGPKIYVQTIFEDINKNIWLGGGYGSWGLYNYKGPKNYIKYTKKDGLVGNLITVIFEDSKGILWVGTRGGISSYDGQNWKMYNEDNGATSKAVSAILEDKQGNIWFGTYGGVFRFDGENWKSFTKKDVLPSNDVLLMKMDRKGDIWVTFGGHSKEWGLLSIGSDIGHKSGVIKYDGKEWRPFTLQEGAPTSQVNKMEIDSKDNVWCDTTYTTGFYVYDGTKWTRYSKEKGFYSNHFYEFEEDSDGNIWLATGSGLLFYNGEEWAQYTIEDGLPGNRIFSVLEDSRGDIWIATTEGVGRLKR